MKTTLTICTAFGFYIIPTVVTEKVFDYFDDIEFEGIEFSFRFLHVSLDIIFWKKI
jgi:hypothetical protein